MQLDAILFWFTLYATGFRGLVADVPTFRVLAPEFICPNDDNSTIGKPNNTIITVKTDTADLQLRWSVRWDPLDRPSQRFTLLLWKTVRALEARLNAPQPEPMVYAINNADLLQGVKYIFNVSASDPKSENSTTKTFSIDNINKEDPTLLIEGQAEKLSVLLVGGDTVFTDMEYVMDAVVITCSPTQNYYFAWSIQSSLASPANDLDTSGSRLEISPYSLQAGQTNYVTCTVYKNSGEFITQTGLPLQVLYRGLAVSLSLDVLIVTINNEFDLRAVVENHDHYGEEKLKFEWSCIYENKFCENFKSINSEIMLFSRGFPYVGRFEIAVLVTVIDQQASSNATIIVIEASLPLIQLEPLNRVVNEHSLITLVANASNVAPSCLLTWYFASEKYLDSLDINTCQDCQHGEEVAGSVAITSLEENFLNELTDFSNETEWRQVVGQVNASSGRARFVAQCGCSLIFNCDTQGIVYADVNLKLNESPKVSEIKVSPETGTAMETVFRFSTLAASDPDKPLRYSFYCNLGTNDTLLLASNLEYLAAEAYLPFIDLSGTKIWIEVCDSLGGCSSSKIRMIQLLEGEGRTVQALLDSMRGHVARCEMLSLRRLVLSAISTYKNANQERFLTTFIKALLSALSSANYCVKNNRDYVKLLDWLIQAGVDISEL